MIGTSNFVEWFILCELLKLYVWSKNKTVSSEVDSLFLFQMQVDFNESAVMVTEPFFNFPSVGEAINEVIFEEYQFQALYRTQGEFLHLCKLCKWL